MSDFIVIFFGKTDLKQTTNGYLNRHRQITIYSDCYVIIKQTLQCILTKLIHPKHIEEGSLWR